MTLKQLFSQATTPTNKAVIETFLMTASDVNSSERLLIKVDYFIEQMIYKYGIYKPLEWLDIEPTTSNFGQIFTRCFGTGASLIGTYKALLKYSELTLGGKILTISGEGSDDTSHTKEKSTSAENTRTYDTTNTTTDSGTDTISNTTLDTGTDNTTTENKLGAWDDNAYKGASYQTDNETRNLSTVVTGTNSSTLSRTSAQDGTVTDNASGTEETTASTTTDKEYSERWEEIGGTPDYISLFDNPALLNLAESFCYYFVKTFCRTTINLW